MNVKELPKRNLIYRPMRTAALFILTFFLSFVIFSGSAVIWSLQNGLHRLEDRLGADIIVMPNSAKTKLNPKAMLLNGTPGYFYMPKEKLVLIRHIEGVDRVSPQIFLASLSASCCSVPVQIIGFDPDTDFLIQPWIRKRYAKELKLGDVVAGASVNADVGSDIRFYNQNCRIVSKLEKTGTGLDTAVYTNAETIRMLIDASSKMGLNTVFKGDVNDIISSVYIKVKNGYEIKKVADNINLRVRKVKAVQTQSMLSEIGGSLSGVSNTIKGLILSIWFMAFIILGIAFSVLIGERKKEFAVLRLLGTSRRMLAGIILKESAILSVAGGIAGVFSGILMIIPFGSLIEASLNLPFLIPEPSKLILLGGVTLLVLGVIGPIAAAYAAFRLSRVDPAAILREGN